MSLSTHAKIGLLTLVSLIVLGGIIIWKTEIFMVSHGYEMIGSFADIEGLTIGSEVRYRGLKIGKIMSIDPGPFDIRISAVIDKSIKMTSDSVLRVAYDGIVGQKYLQIRPGTSETLYVSPMILYGIKTSAIVDFVDIGAQSLEEGKAILKEIRTMIQDPQLKGAFYRTVFTADKVAGDLDKLTSELRLTNKGIKDIVTDEDFQMNIKGTIKETEQTLSSANKFFNAVGSMNMRVSAGLDIGNVANAVKGNVDVVQSDDKYFRLGLGEGPTRQLGLLDVLFNSKVGDNFGFRLGVINNQLGGGVAVYPNNRTTWRGDVYDINNTTLAGARLNPKIRLGYEYELRDYMDLAIKGDDLLNVTTRNITFGILVKPPGDRLY